MANIVSKALNSVLTVVLPKAKTNPLGTSVTDTYNPSNTTNILPVPAYNDHLTDIFTTRASGNSVDLIKSMMINDPDMSATVSAFLTVADTQMNALVKDPNGQIVPEEQITLQSIITNMTTRMDYTLPGGYKIVKDMSALTEEYRYMLLAQGAIGGELIMNKEFWPTDLRIVDMNKVQWFEPQPGQYVPRQTTLTGAFISLDIPTFMTAWYRQDPTSIYSYSPFVSAINTIAARQQIINDLYRIMSLTGYPRMDVSVLEDVIRKNMPASAKLNDGESQAYIQGQLRVITTALSSLNPGQAFVHTDAIKVDAANSKAPGMALDITPVIGVLNAQNQASLKVMSTLIGRGESGVNTASTEARIFSMNADALNKPIANLLSQAFSLALRLTGSVNRVEVTFAPAEMRSALELEPQLVMKASRLKEDLSLGIISDVEYSMQMYGRLPNPDAPPLSGTGFANIFENTLDPGKAAATNDPLGSTLKPAGSNSAASNASKSGSPKGAKSSAVKAAMAYLAMFGSDN